MKMDIYRFGGICLFFLFINLSAQERPVIENSISIDSAKLHYYCLGSGSQTIVLDVGIGETYRDWLPFLKNLSKNSVIFCYDRAGYDQSEMGTLPRNSEKEADDLKKLLDKANIKGPYVLVGHSLGALNLQVFAHKNAQDVAGMLLLDPPPLDWLWGKRFPQMTILAEQTTSNFEKLYEDLKNSKNKEDKQKANFFQTLASEHREMFLSSAKQVAGIKSFEDLPLIVIASDKPNPAFGDEADSFQKFWNDQCRQLAMKSSKGKYWLASESSHHIHLDNPGIVLKAINELLSK